MKKIQNIKNKNKGFTIVELIVVMAIIAILILIAVPTFTKYIDNANRTARMGTADTIFKSAVSAMVEDYASTTHEEITVGTTPLDTGLNDADEPTLAQNILDGVDGSVDDTLSVYAYDGASTTAPTRVTGNTNWQVFIPATAGVADATEDVYIISPDGTVFLNGDEAPAAE